MKRSALRVRLTGSEESPGFPSFMKLAELVARVEEARQGLPLGWQSGAGSVTVRDGP